MSRSRAGRGKAIERAVIRNSAVGSNPLKDRIGVSNGAVGNSRVGLGNMDDFQRQYRLPTPMALRP